ncbi:hypothetical protein GIB67_023163 [Kingdonia uniflora]|uniref:Phytocyanin domain-containing protein n=1 Tax=Kingdonia uniflora TaxID=39325 RepID=A0A7J7M607_9MAGN|nr:hypothetical protein GIB67_023163 [Kingdonia uniflora]
MYQRTSLGYMSCKCITPFLFLLLCSSLLLSLPGSVVEAYKNYTVGDSLGWYDNTQKPSVNYQKWVGTKNFSLGDFLFFNTDNNHSIIQTYNFTTYKECDFEDAELDDTIEWSTGDPSFTNLVPVTRAVPLTKEGITYFFSGDFDGEQCQHGQHFKINVTHGQGLPESLKSPSTVESPAPTSPDDDSIPNPDTPVSSNFNNPKESGDDKEPTSFALVIRLLDMKLHMLMMFVCAWLFF